jgi:hypothetical protein
MPHHPGRMKLQRPSWKLRQYRGTGLSAKPRRLVRSTA